MQKSMASFSDIRTIATCSAVLFLAFGFFAGSFLFWSAFAALTILFLGAAAIFFLFDSRGSSGNLGFFAIGFVAYLASLIPLTAGGVISYLFR